MMENKGGLVPITEDKRDFALGAIFKLPELSELPEKFELVNNFPVKSQGQTDKCSAYATCGMSELQEDVELYPEWTFAASKEISGDPESWGQNMRDSFKSQQKYGAVEQSEVSDILLNTPQSDLRRLSAYPREYIQRAKKHRKQSYFKVTGQHDDFSNIKASIWKFREQKQAVAVGMIWSWSLSQYILDNPQERGFGHMGYVVGWNEKGLIFLNSYGEQAGQNGKHIIKRDVINAYAKRFGIMMMVDLSPEAVKQLLANQGFFKRLWILLLRIFNLVG